MYYIDQRLGQLLFDRKLSYDDFCFVTWFVGLFMQVSFSFTDSIYLPLKHRCRHGKVIVLFD